MDFSNSEGVMRYLWIILFLSACESVDRITEEPITGPIISILKSL